MVKEIVLQKIGRMVFCARVDGHRLILFCETESGNFTGFSMRVNSVLKRNLLQLIDLLGGENDD
jgi:hypothetical protein